MTVDAVGLGVRLARQGPPRPDGLDLHLGPGEQVLLLGPSGSGKSTVLHALTGVVPRTRAAVRTGSVRVLGQDPAQVPVPRTALRVGWLAQDPASGTCLPTVDAEVALPLENRGVPRAEIGPRVRAALAAVDGLALAGRRTAELSGGEQQRVALAAVLVGEPEVLLLDEPTAMLDPVAAEGVLRLLARHGRHRTTLLVEHRLADLALLPPRAVLLDHAGRVVGDGPTDAVLACAGRPGQEPSVRRRRRPAGEVVLSLDHAGFGHGGRDVVRGVSLRLCRGRVTVVVGRNGSGKSTLLLGAAGLVPGGPLAGGPVGLVFQRPEHQLLARTVAGEVAHGLLRARRLRRPDAQVRTAVAQALAQAGLTALADQDPFRLSGGQQRRLSVAAMTVLTRPVLALDEPTFGLDPDQRASVLAAVEGVAARGSAVLVATHDLSLARRFADEVLVLRDGEVLAYGDPSLLDDHGLLVAAGLALAGTTARSGAEVAAG